MIELRPQHCSQQLAVVTWFANIFKHLTLTGFHSNDDGAVYEFEFEAVRREERGTREREKAITHL